MFLWYEFCPNYSIIKTRLDMLWKNTSARNPGNINLLSLLSYYIYLLCRSSPGHSRGRDCSWGAVLQCNWWWQPRTWQQRVRCRDSFMHSCVVLQGAGSGATEWLTPPHTDWCYGSVSETICHIWPCHFQSLIHRQMHKCLVQSAGKGPAHLKPQHEKEGTPETQPHSHRQKCDTHIHPDMMHREISMHTQTCTNI